MRKIWFANCMLAVAAPGCTSTEGSRRHRRLHEHRRRARRLRAPWWPPSRRAGPTSSSPSMKEYSPDMFGDKKAAKAAPGAFDRSSV